MYKNTANCVGVAYHGLDIIVWQIVCNSENKISSYREWQKFGETTV